MTVMGIAPKGASIRRSGANPGDIVYVTGTLGDAAGGLAILGQDKKATGHLIDRYYYPNPRLETGLALRGIASAAIDLSDGLLADLAHICKASDAGARIIADNLPLSTALTGAFAADQARAFALGAGDDYELCFTAPAGAADRIAEVARSTGVIVTAIGDITADDGVCLTDRAGHPLSAGQAGYQHFDDA
jgi:thiamine-monophosphate kinase